MFTVYIAVQQCGVFVQWSVNTPHVHCLYCSATMQCIRAMECEYALCSLFAPGDRHVIIGTKVRCCFLYKAQFSETSGCL